MRTILVFLTLISCQRPIVLKTERKFYIDTLSNVYLVEPVVKVSISTAKTFNLIFKDSFYIIKEDTILRGFGSNLVLEFLEGKPAKLEYYKILGRYSNVSDAVLEISSLSKIHLNFIVKTIGIKLSNVDTREYLLLQGPYSSLDSIIEGRKLALLSKRQEGTIFIKYGSYEKKIAIPFEIHSKKPITIKDFIIDDGLNPPKNVTRTYEGYFEVWTDISGKNILIVNVINFENYIKGILPYEMSTKFPLEALRAQAVLARSHALSVYKKKLMLLSQPYDLTSDVWTQVYGGITDVNDSVELAVKLTKGQFLVFSNNLVHALFHSGCGGILDDGNLWNNPLSYYSVRYDNDLNQSFSIYNDSILKLFIDNSDFPSYCNTDKFYGAKSVFRWKSVFKISEIEKKLKKKIENFEILERSNGGRVKKLKIKFLDGDTIIEGELNIRRFFYKEKEGYLKSALFYIERDGDNLIIKGGGFGHGIGLCQYGAGQRALLGQAYYQIISSYFNNVDIQRLY